MATVGILARGNIDAVINYPETGMSYQLFQIRMNTYALVISSLVAVRFESRGDLFQALPEANGMLALIAGPELYAPPFEDTFGRSYDERPWGELLNRSDPRVFSLLDTGPPKRAGRPIELFYNMPGAEPQLFFRYSANHADPRVMRDGRVMAGTYATTFNDIRMVPSGLAAVGRYALPVTEAARFMYPIVTDAPYRMGTSIPHFGQAGGGVEVLFESEFDTLVARPHMIPIG